MYLQDFLWLAKSGSYYAILSITTSHWWLFNRNPGSFHTEWSGLELLQFRKRAIHKLSLSFWNTNSNMEGLDENQFFWCADFVICWTIWKLCLCKSLDIFGWKHMMACSKIKDPKIKSAQMVPALCTFWDLEKSVLHEIGVSGTVVSPLLSENPPLART